MGQATTLERKKPSFRLRIPGLGAPLFFALVAAALYLGWSMRQRSYLTAEDGLGYALGIIGGVMMLLLLVYPLRKRLSFMRHWGATRHWFRMHMAFGVLGPVLILFHANFQLGSLNSSVALISMLVVAISGLFGRYFYTKIHYGLYGSRASLEELHRRILFYQNQFSASFAEAPAVIEPLIRFAQQVLEPRPGVMRNCLLFLSLGFRTRLAAWSAGRVLKRSLRQKARRAGWSRARTRRQHRALRRRLHDYLTATRRGAEFIFYERLFSLWHVLHLPLFFLLVVAGIVHVVAVHMY